MGIRRLFLIFVAVVKANIYCIWRMLRYYDPVFILEGYNGENKLILIATIRYSNLDNVDKVFYNENKTEV